MIIPYLSLGGGRYLDSAGDVHRVKGDQPDPMIEFEAVKLDDFRGGKAVYDDEYQRWAEVAASGGHDLDQLLNPGGTPPPTA